MQAPGRKSKVFISYSRKDRELVDEILPYLMSLESEGTIELLYDGKIEPGEMWDEQLTKYIRVAEIIIVMLSPDSLASEFVKKEIDVGLIQMEAGSSKLLPVLLRDCDWQHSGLEKIVIFPGTAKPINEYSKEERAGRLYFELQNAIVDIANRQTGNDWTPIINKEATQKTGTLNLSNYNLSSIPKSILGMHWLHSLILSNNQIEDISLIGTLKNLESIYLSNNRITDASSLNGLPKLSYLDLNNNRLSQSRTTAGFFAPELRFLYLKQNSISFIPDLSGLTNLKELDLSNNNINEIKGLENLVNLGVLNLSDNKIKKIENLQTLTALTDLRLSGNSIESITGLDALENLKTLDLYKNQVSVIGGLGKNTKLGFLGLSSNKINVLENISHLQSLESLYIAHNNIDDITELQNLKSLKRVVMTNNKIADLFPLKGFIEKDIPVKAEYSFNQQENGFFVKDNPVKYPPLEVLAQGKGAILRNFQLQEKSLQEQLDAYQSNDIKLILIGNANVGKSFLAKYILSEKTELPPNNASTHGMANHFVEYKLSSGNTIRMRILDFGGQEYYHDTHHLFFTTDTIYMLLWEKDSNRFGTKEEKRFSDKTNKEEIEINNVFPVAYWLDAVNYFINKKEEQRKKNVILEPMSNVAAPAAEQTLDPVLIVIETKRNKKGAFLLDTSTLLPYKNLIHSQVAISLTNGENGSIINTGTDSLFDSLNDLAGTMFEKKWSGYYKLVVEFFENLESDANKKILEKLGADKLIIQLQGCVELFNKIIKNSGLKYKFDNINATDLCRFLANRGYILYFDETRICLYHERLTKEIYTVLNKEYNNIGIITNEEALGIDATLLSIMQDFKLLIPHPADIGFIAPQLLPASTNNQLSMFFDAFKPPVLRFSITGYIHKNIIQELFYAFKESLLKEDTRNYIWKNGFIVKLDNELYKLDIRSNENCRLIEVQYLNSLNSGKLNEIGNTISKSLEGRRFEKEVSLDGQLFVPFRKIQQNVQLSQFVHEDKLLRVADYKNFLDESEKKHAMKKLFISYSSKNTDFMRRFVTHLEPLKRNGDINYWHDRMIEPGTKWDDEIKKEMETSDIIIFLLSPDFIATNYIFDIEIPKALEHFKNQTAKLFFLELQPCSWDKTDLAHFQQTTASGGSNKALITIGQPLNDEKWKEAIGELEKKLV
jgi:internalin A